jgi:hypothetical protein
MSGRYNVILADLATPVSLDPRDASCSITQRAPSVFDGILERYRDILISLDYPLFMRKYHGRRLLPNSQA